MALRDENIAYKMKISIIIDNLYLPM